MWVISIYTSLWKSCQDNNKKIPTLINQLYFQVPVYYVILILRAESILHSDLLLYVALFWCMWQCKLTNNFFRLQVFSKSTLSGVLSECKVKHIAERMALQAHSNLFSHFFFTHTLYLLFPLATNTFCCFHSFIMNLLTWFSHSRLAYQTLRTLSDMRYVCNRNVFILVTAVASACP